MHKHNNSVNYKQMVLMVILVFTITAWKDIKQGFADGYKDAQQIKMSRDNPHR